MTLDMNASSLNPLGQYPVAGAMSAVANSVSSAASSAVTTAMNVVNTTASAANSVATTAVNAASSAVNSIASPMNKGISFNSLIPFGNSSPPPTNKNTVNSKNSTSGSSVFNIFGSNSSGSKKTSGANNSSYNIFGTSSGSSSGSSNASSASNASNASNAGSSTMSWVSPLWIFIALLFVFLIIFAVLNAQIRNGYEYLSKSIKQSMGIYTQPIEPPIPLTPVEPPVITAPIAPQTITPKQNSQINSLVEKVLPTGGNEVFNVSQNKFTYYDAEPLCKALGAELASYDQVKDAWSKGADWCNYGWVKGQMAVYPTQQGTYDSIQSGPPEEHGACGAVGMNGGYFDNPEMLYGVNCYGKKPPQSAHDEEMLMKNGKIPKTVAALKVDQKVREFDADVDSMLVRPFSDSKWSSA